MYTDAFFFLGDVILKVFGLLFALQWRIPIIFWRGANAHDMRPGFQNRYYQVW